MSLSVLRTIPILRIFDLAKAREFYVDFLGFKIEWEHRFEGVSPVYMRISRAGCVLHLSEHYGDGSPGVHVFLEVRGVKEFHQELTAKQYGYLRPGLEETFHNSYQVTVIDPFGNRLHFDESKAPPTLV
jgi:hypothetical protein